MNQYSVHIKIVNTQSKYECIVVRSNDPGRVYRAIDRLDCSIAVWDVDGVYPSSDCCCTQQPLLLAFRLILIISRVVQYVVYGGLWFRQELRIGRYSFNCKGGLTSVDCLPDISSEVVDPD